MKAHIEEVLRRYSYIQTALKEGKTEVNFYVGKRKQKIVIDATLKIILTIIEDITKKEKDIYIKMMIEGIKKGDSDKYYDQSSHAEKCILRQEEKVYRQNLSMLYL